MELSDYLRENGDEIRDIPISYLNEIEFLRCKSVQ